VEIVANCTSPCLLSAGTVGELDVLKLIAEGMVIFNFRIK